MARIAGIDIPREKRIEASLRYIHGIGAKRAEEICNDLVPLLRREILYLKSIGCKEIQIDEPLFARQPQKALTWGIDLLNCIIIASYIITSNIKLLA